MAGQEYLCECSHGARLAKAAFEWTDSLVTLWPSIDAVSRTGEFWRILHLARTFTDVVTVAGYDRLPRCLSRYKPVTLKSKTGEG